MSQTRIRSGIEQDVDGEEGTAHTAALSQLLLGTRTHSKHGTRPGRAGEEDQDPHSPSKPSDPIPERCSGRIAHTPSFTWEVGNLIPGRGKLALKEVPPQHPRVPAHPGRSDGRWNQDW